MTRLTTKRKIFPAKRLAMLSVLCAMGLIMFMVESLFPPLFLPGAKMGLSNIFSLLTVFVLGPLDAVVLVLVRTTLGSVFTGNLSTLMYSMSAGLVSVAVSSLLVEFLYPRVSVVAVSVVSAVMHNLTQNVVFCLISNTPQMFSYMPWLALLGVVAGIIVGFAVWFILRTLPLKTFASVLGATEKDFLNAVEVEGSSALLQQKKAESATEDTATSQTELAAEVATESATSPSAEPNGTTEPSVADERK